MDSNLPVEWRTTALQACSLKIQDGTHFSPQSTSGPCRYITSKNIRPGYMDLTDCGWITEAEHRAIYRRCDVALGDVLLTKDGANTGNAALNTLAEPFSLLSSVAFIRPDPSQASGRFILQYLLSRGGQSRMRDMMSGNAITRLTLTKIKGFAVPLPPLPEQRHIAEILDTIDEAIRKTEQVIAKLQQMKQGLLHDLLTRGIDENGELRDPERHPEQFQDSLLGRIPRAWVMRTTLEVASKDTGSTTIGPFGSNLKADDYRNCGVPVVFVRDVREDGFQWNSNVYLTPAKARSLVAHAVEPGDVLASKMGLPPCIAATYPSWMETGIVTADMIRLRPSLDVVRSSWVVTYLNSPPVRAQVRAITGGVTRPKVTLADFRRLRLAVPSLSEQDRLLARLAGLDSTLHGEDTQANKLRTMKHGLMDDLLTGRVRVSLPDEEAS